MGRCGGWVRCGSLAVSIEVTLDGVSAFMAGPRRIMCPKHGLSTPRPDFFKASVRILVLRKNQSTFWNPCYV